MRPGCFLPSLVHKAKGKTFASICFSKYHLVTVRNIQRSIPHKKTLRTTQKQSKEDYWLTILTWPTPSSWSLEDTISPTENSILQRLSIDVSSAPLPLSDICSSCPLVLLSAGQSVCVCVCLRVCMYGLRWGWLGG